MRSSMPPSVWEDCERVAEKQRAFVTVWWYVPTVGEMSALWSERDQLQASIEHATQPGARIKLNSCGSSGDSKRLCVFVDQTAGRFDNARSGENSTVAKGYCARNDK
jgi:hypothetical protein